MPHGDCLSMKYISLVGLTQQHCEKENLCDIAFAYAPFEGKWWVFFEILVEGFVVLYDELVKYDGWSTTIRDVGGNFIFIF
jgi:hypothetical protein